MLVLIGPSASGKTEVANLLIKKYNMSKVVTCTTRKIRQGEVDKVHYNFMSVDDFLEKEKNDEFVETTFYNGNYYGTLKKDISDNKIIVLDPNGLKSFYDKMPKEIVSFYLDASEDIRHDRMIFRKDRGEDIEKRLANDKVVFDVSKLENVDFIIDSSCLSLDDMSEKVYTLYNSKKEK